MSDLYLTGQLSLMDIGNSQDISILILADFFHVCLPLRFSFRAILAISISISSTQVAKFTIKTIELCFPFHFFCFFFEELFFPFLTRIPHPQTPSRSSSSKPPPQLAFLLSSFHLSLRHLHLLLLHVELFFFW